MATTSPTTDRALPAITPSALALLLSSAVVLAVGGRSMAGASGFAAGWGTWCLAAGIALIASFRSTLPAVPGRGGGVLWIGAGVLGGALLARHALVSLMGAWTDFSVDAGTAPALSQGDSLVLAALLAPSLVIALASRLRSPRPGLLVPALLGLAPLLLLVLPMASRGVPAANLRPDVAGGFSAITIPAALLWATTLPGPAALPLSTRRPLLHHWLPRLLGVAVLVGLPLLLLTGARPPVELVSLEGPGQSLFGRYGGEVGAGMECFVTLVALHVLLVLCARVAARSLPGLRSGIFPALALGTGLSAAWIPAPILLAGAALTGWAAVLWGIEPEGAGSPPMLEGPHD